MKHHLRLNIDFFNLLKPQPITSIYQAKNRSSIQTGVLLGFIFLQCLVGDSVSANSVAELVRAEVQHSIERDFPNLSLTKVKIPSFLNSSTERIDKVSVSFPSGLHEDRLIAQVWVEAQGQSRLIAIPVQLISEKGKVSNFSLASHE